MNKITLLAISVSLCLGTQAFAANADLKLESPSGQPQARTQQVPLAPADKSAVFEDCISASIINSSVSISGGNATYKPQEWSCTIKDSLTLDITSKEDKDLFLRIFFHYKSDAITYRVFVDKCCPAGNFRATLPSQATFSPGDEPSRLITMNPLTLQGIAYTYDYAHNLRQFPKQLNMEKEDLEAMQRKKVIALTVTPQGTVQLTK